VAIELAEQAELDRRVVRRLVFHHLAQEPEAGLADRRRDETALVRDCAGRGHGLETLFTKASPISISPDRCPSARLPTSGWRTEIPLPSPACKKTK